MPAQGSASLAPHLHLRAGLEMRNTSTKTLKLLLLTLIAAWSACRHAAKTADAPPFHVEGDVVVFADGRRPSAVSIEAVRSEGDDYLTVTGRLVWDEDTTVRIFAPVSGRVTSIRVRFCSTRSRRKWRSCRARGSTLMAVASTPCG